MSDDKDPKNESVSTTDAETPLALDPSLLGSLDSEPSKKKRGRAESTPNTATLDSATVEKIFTAVAKEADKLALAKSSTNASANASNIPLTAPTPAKKPWVPRLGSTNFLSLPRELRDPIYEEWIRSVKIILAHSRHNPFPASLLATHNALSLLHTHPAIRQDLSPMLPILPAIHMVVDVKSRIEGRRLHPYLTCTDISGVLEKLLTPTVSSIFNLTNLKVPNHSCSSLSTSIHLSRRMRSLRTRTRTSTMFPRTKRSCR